MPVGDSVVLANTEEPSSPKPGKAPASQLVNVIQVREPTPPLIGPTYTQADKPTAHTLLPFFNNDEKEEGHHQNTNTPEPENITVPESSSPALDRVLRLRERIKKVFGTP